MALFKSKPTVTTDQFCRLYFEANLMPAGCATLEDCCRNDQERLARIEPSIVQKEGWAEEVLALKFETCLVAWYSKRWPSGCNHIPMLDDSARCFLEERDAEDVWESMDIYNLALHEWVQDSFLGVPLAEKLLKKQEADREKWSELWKGKGHSETIVTRTARRLGTRTNWKYGREGLVAAFSSALVREAVEERAKKPLCAFVQATFDHAAAAIRSVRIVDA